MMMFYFKKKYVIFLNQSRFVRFIKLQVDSLEGKKKKKVNRIEKRLIYQTIVFFN